MSRYLHLPTFLQPLFQLPILFFSSSICNLLNSVAAAIGYAKLEAVSETGQTRPVL